MMLDRPTESFGMDYLGMDYLKIRNCLGMDYLKIKRKIPIFLDLLFFPST